jgi:hypothetical protein
VYQIVTKRLQYRQAAVWYEEGTSKLVSRYDKCLNVQGDYVEKYVKVCDKTCIFFFLPIINKYFLMPNVLYFLDASRTINGTTTAAGLDDSTSNTSQFLA